MNQRHRVIVFFVAGLLLIAMLSATATLPLSAGGPETGQVTIIRDEYGVPHVFGSTPESLWYGVGYAQAQDRLWQADLLRRQSSRVRYLVRSSIERICLFLPRPRPRWF
jgi:acyl-homoserine lactone acylase PvdQ